MRKLFNGLGLALFAVALASCSNDSDYYTGESDNIAYSVEQGLLNGTWEAVSVEGVINVNDRVNGSADVNLNVDYRYGADNGFGSEYFVRLTFEDKVLRSSAKGGHDYMAKTSVMASYVNGAWVEGRMEFYAFPTPNTIKILYNVYEVRELTDNKLVLYISGDMASEWCTDLIKDYHYMIMTFRRI